MPTSFRPTGRAGAPPLHWQSQLVLLATIPLLGVWITLAAGDAWMAQDPMLIQAACISVGFAALVHVLRAATLGGAITGAIVTAALYLQTPGWRTALWPLLALFLLTFAATKFGRTRKEAMGTAEGRRGRTSAQVAANLGVAALAGIPISTLHVFSPTTFDSRAALVAMLAALAEATADTLSSELGQVLGGEPRLILNGKQVPAGTDGAITLVGTLAGSLGAALVVLVGALVLPVTRVEAALACGAGIAGLFIDSLLGALPERRGWLNNDAVNALSTLAAALIAAWLSELLLAAPR